MELSKSLKVLFIYITLTAPIGAVFAETETNESVAGHSIRWQKLLYAYKSFGSWKSYVDNKKYFLYSMDNEDWNPEKEFQATLKIFQDEIQNKKFNYLCKFLARRELMENMGVLRPAFYQCDDFKSWQMKVAPESISLIFSSSYPNNPASVFGHTFLRFNHKKRNNLLHYATAYSARVDRDEAGILYALKGLFGFYQGQYDLNPYYMKVNEYNHSENRDLYEYNLNLTKSESHFLLKHLWELYHFGSFDYYFLDENCSFILAKFIEVARPKLNLSQLGIFDWYYLPTRLTKEVFKAGLVNSIDFRPSRKKILITSLEHLTNTKKFANNIGKALKDDDSKDVNLLDTKLNYLEYKQYKKGEEFSRANKELLQTTLIQRSKVKEQSAKLNYDEKNAPHLGHEDYLFRVGGKSHKKQGERNEFLLLNFGFGNHDLLARDIGFEPFNEFSYFSLETSLDLNSNILRFEQANLITVNSLHDYSYIDPQLSWQIETNILREYENSLKGVKKAKAQAGFGLNSIFLKRDDLISGLATFLGASFKYSPGNPELGPYAEVMIYSNFLKKFKLVYKGTLFSNALKKIQEDYYLKQSLDLSIFPYKDFDLRMHTGFYSKLGSFKKNFHQTSLTLGYYY